MKNGQNVDSESQATPDSGTSGPLTPDRRRSLRAEFEGRAAELREALVGGPLDRARDRSAELREFLGRLEVEVGKSGSSVVPMLTAPVGCDVNGTATARAVLLRIAAECFASGWLVRYRLGGIARESTAFELLERLAGLRGAGR